MRSEYDAYAVGRLDFGTALASGQALRCSLTAEEQKDRKLVQRWVHGVNHQELHTKAHSPVLKVQLAQIKRELLPR